MTDNVVDIEANLPHAVIEGPCNVHSVPLVRLQRMARGDAPLILDEHQDECADLLRGIIAAWLQSKGELSNDT